MKKITPATKNTTNLCLELIRFGVSSNLIFLDREYYKYRGGKKEEQGLAMGGYESVFLAELVASKLFDNAKQLYN